MGEGSPEEIRPMAASMAYRGDLHDPRLPRPPFQIAADCPRIPGARDRRA